MGIFIYKGNGMLRDTDYMKVINEIVANSIDEGIYKKVIRKVYELQRKRKGNIKDSTIYKRAYQLCK